MGERTTDLRVFAGHKVTHTVSTQNASRAARAKLEIMGGPQQGQDGNMCALRRVLWFIMPNMIPH